MLADTNSGKSTLMNLLGRISELKQHSGTDPDTELKRVIHETLIDSLYIPVHLLQNFA